MRRRFTDFLFLFKQLTRDYPQCAVPPLPDKHKLEYVRGDRFGPDFTHRRARSLHRFLNRIALHPVLRRAALLILFLESPDWNQTMRGRTARGGSLSDASPGGLGSGVGPGAGSAPSGVGSGGIMDSIADTFVNTFSKVHKPDKRFMEVREKADKLDEDLSNVEKVMVRVARREGDLEHDYADLATQCQRLMTLEPSLEAPLTSFAASLSTTAQGFRALRDHTDQDYLASLRDMETYIQSVKTLLRARESKQLDFEALSEYLAKAASDRDVLASAQATSAGGGGGAANGGHHHAGGSASSATSVAASAVSNASGFLRAKLEDVRGIDPEQARRGRLRRLELDIDRLTREVETARTTSEAFDMQTVSEVADFERIKAVEFRDTLGALADQNAAFYADIVSTWERFLDGLGDGDGDGDGDGEHGTERGGGGGGGGGSSEGDGGVQLAGR